MRRLHLAVVALLCVGSTRSAYAEATYHVEGYSQLGVTLRPDEASQQGGEIYWSAYIVNETGAWLTVDPTRVRAKLGKGRVLGTARKPPGLHGKKRRLAPGQGYQLFAQFKVGPTPRPIRIQLANAIRIGGQRAKLPDLEITVRNPTD